MHWGETEFLSESTWAFSSHIVFLVTIGFVSSPSVVLPLFDTQLPVGSRSNEPQIVQMYYAFKLSSLYKEPVRSWLVSSIAVFAAGQLGEAAKLF